MTKVPEVEVARNARCECLNAGEDDRAMDALKEAALAAASMAGIGWGESEDGAIV